MVSIPEKSNLEAIYVITNYGLGSKVVKTAKKCGVTGGTIFLGREL